ncbi:hypothetical protein TEA_015206 [Camellia sinensis var. sinensis]|uniref:Uncharacterized protein n=1 Tax=Camellia sinensis var. sinensis TaxID=542762 RepID=A0A4S4DC33_CAMSN|nr:hypothetical protein TEA_015206 [Camellia sinensis var. sinensis]
MTLLLRLSLIPLLQWLPLILILLNKALEIASSNPPLILMPQLKDRLLLSTDSAMADPEIAVAIVRSFMLPADDGWLREQADVAIFSQALHFSLAANQEATTKAVKDKGYAEAIFANDE